MGSFSQKGACPACGGEVKGMLLDIIRKDELHICKDGAEEEEEF